jgi:hypothetical protein
MNHLDEAKVGVGLLVVLCAEQRLADFRVADADSIRCAAAMMNSTRQRK